MRTIAEREAAADAALNRLETLGDRIKGSADGSEAEAEAIKEYDHARIEEQTLRQQLDDAKADLKAREVHRTRGIPLAEGGFARVGVNEPDKYGKHNRSFLQDLYRAQVGGDLVAQERLSEHQAYELEKRDNISSSFGGLIPPQYLIAMYGKALRNGRVFVDQVKREELPEVGMSLIIPRLTTGTEAGIQAAENDPVANQDLVESDLTVPVRTIAGYVGVSRQGLERAQYNEEIIFEDLIARNWATLDYQCLNGSGNSGEHLGLNQTQNINVVALGSWSIQNFWGTLADSCQRIASATGGLGLVADKIFMHPRRWAGIASSLDASDRPLLLPAPAGGGQGFNVIAGGSTGSYGAVGEMFGCQVFTDPNIPTNQGIGSDEDLVFVIASPAVHVWERMNDPVTLSFPQQAGNELNVKLVMFSYSSFTAAIYPTAAAVITGAGLVPPSYGVIGT